MKQLPNASAVASAISLLGQYLGEERQRSRAGLDPYVDWLRENGHQELGELILSNTSVADSLCALTEQHRD
jgi:hypothetical protein